MAAQQRGQGTSPWDNAIQAPRDVRGGSGMNPMGDCGSAAGTGISGGRAGEQASLWDNSTDAPRDVPKLTDVRPGDGRRTADSVNDDSIKAKEPNVPGGDMQGARNLGQAPRAGTPAKLTFDQGDGRNLANSRRAEDMGRRR